MASTVEPVSKIAEAAALNIEKTEPISVGSDSKDGDPEVGVEGGTAPLTRVKSKFGDRPECFANTLQEMSFVFMATVATATTSFLAGTAQIITVAVSKR